MRWLPALLLVMAVLVPYHQMLVGRVIPIPDDIFVSDLVDGEFPYRVEAARLVCAGEVPVWTSQLFTGQPLSSDPLSILLFSGLPPALALGWLIGLLLVVASLGTYLLARQLGASCAGAVLAGFAYAWSGFFVCQLRHLGVLGVVAWFPLALFCLEMAATGAAPDPGGARAVTVRRRLAWLTGFAAVFGMQCLAGFPQSVYVSALVYAALVASRMAWLLAPGERCLPLSLRLAPVKVLALGALGAVAVGTLVGMVALLPLRELGTVSDRSGAGTYEWATQFAYWPRNFLTFFAPYANGDIADGTYRGTSIFWEDYGYVGLVTVLLAILAVVLRVRRFAVAFWGLAALVAYGLVLGRETPLYRIAFHLVPGLDTFRFPTRFLFVVELALAILGGLGLTLVQEFVARKVATEDVGKRISIMVGVLVVAWSATDLVYQNYRQNPFIDAGVWLAPPRAAAIIQADGTVGRVFTPGSAMHHRSAFRAARGWSGDLSPYFAQREFLQPNSNLLHHLPTVDGYTGISPRWTVDLIGDHNRRGILDRLYALDGDGFRAAPALFDWLEALSVRWVILPWRVSSERLEHIGTAAPAEVYRLRGTLARARVVTQGRMIPTMDELWQLIVAGKIDPRREVVLHDPAAEQVIAALPSGVGDGDSAGDARIVVDRSTEVVVEATAPHGGLLLLADTFYPGWEATVDGRPATILRANVAHRAVELAPGTHRVVFAFRPRSAIAGLALTSLGILSLFIAALCTLCRPRVRHSCAM
jgi:hypothetical protein